MFLLAINNAAFSNVTVYCQQGRTGRLHLIKHNKLPIEPQRVRRQQDGQKPHCIVLPAGKVEQVKEVYELDFT